jgi:hypothetical protein
MKLDFRNLTKRKRKEKERKRKYCVKYIKNKTSITISNVKQRSLSPVSAQKVG